MFVLPVVTGICLMFAAIAYRQGYFERYDEVGFVIDSAAGLTRGMPVKLKGMMIGQVRDISPLGSSAASDNRIAVLLSLNQRYTRFIPNDSKVGVGQDGLIGQDYIEILPGSGLRVIASGESLQFEKRRGLKEIMDEASREAIPMLQDARGFVRRLSDPEGELLSGLKSSAQLARQLPEIGRQTLVSVHAAQGAIDEIRTRSNSVFNEVDGRLPTLLDKASTALDSARETSAHIRDLAAELREPVVGMAEDGRHLSAEGRQIVGAAKQAWPLNAILSPPAHAPLSPDSAGEAAILRPRSEP